MNRVLVMAGAFLAISVLLTSAIVPAVEAKPFSDRKESGIVANCRIDREGTSTIMCTFSDKDGIGPISWSRSTGDPETDDGDCDTRYKDTAVRSPGFYLVSITDCAEPSNEKTFCYEKKEGKKLNQILPESEDYKSCPFPDDI